jgi:hypothetical protein
MVELLCCPTEVLGTRFCRCNSYVFTFFVLSFYLAICWCLELREERRVFENRVLRRIFELKRDEVTGEWRKLHNVELKLCSSPAIVG